MTNRRRLAISDVGDIAVVRFVDRKIVDSANIEEMGDEMYTLVDDDNRRKILLNFENVEFLSSAALNKLILMDKKVKQAGGKLKLCHMRAEIKEVFSLTRLDRLFDIRNTEKDAVEAF